MSRIRNSETKDAAAIAAIYNRFVSDTIITFEETTVSPEEMETRIAGISAAYPYLVLVDEQELLGYAYASSFHERPAYQHTVETTIYLAPEASGKGNGSLLYGELLKQLASRGLKTAIGVIALPNPASVKLHEKLGFVNVGCLRGVGRKFEQWVDTGYWQRDLSFPSGVGDDEPANDP